MMVLHLARELSRAGHPVRVVSLHGDETDVAGLMRRAGVDVVALNKAGGPDPRTVLRLRAQMRDFSPAVVHTHLPVLEYVLPAARLYGRRVRIIHTVHNVSAARNAGIAAARGGCLIFVDADDLVAPDFVETLLRLLGAPGCDCAAVGVRAFWNRPGDFGAGTVRVLDGRDALRAVLGPCRGFICNKAYRTSIVREHGMRLHENVEASPRS